METIKYTDNVIPTMTSNTTPSGKASASSIWTETYTYSAYKAFDHVNSGHVSGWATARNVNTGWLEYDFTTEKCITKYTITPRDWTEALNQLPKDWTFEAYDENINDWVVLDKQSNVTDWKVLTKKEFTFTNTNSYTNYRINISQTNGGTIITIDELEMMETVNTQSSLKVVLGVGESLQLSVNNDLDVNLKMSWYSDDESIATIDANGIVTGVTSGSTVITVTSADETYKETINLLVKNDETDFHLAIDLSVGDTRSLTVDDLTDTVSATWASSNQAIATVSDTGKVTAVGVGTTYVTVTDDQGNEIGKICVRVRK